ncbi:MAG: hypothetical protein HY078_16395 [Elusimicrobia bacterium]|nr:hypothetical protein [Elusimicrobiota bacterium]
MRMLSIAVLSALLYAGPALAGSFEEEYAGPGAAALSPKMRAFREQWERRQDDRKNLAESAKAPIVFDSDVDSALQQQIHEDLSFVGGLQGTASSGLHRKIFGEMAGADYIQFFEKRIKEVGMDDCGGGAGTVACVRPFFFPNKMWLTKNYVRFNQPQVSRVETVFHEARHTESDNGGWSHAMCPTPFRDENGQDVRGILSGTLIQGKAACDRTEFGAYSTGLVMLKNIQKFCANCTDKVKMDAGIFGDDVLKRIIDARAKTAIQDDLYR